MATITTARILADKALQQTCGQECVDWAISMLEQGREGRCLAILAGSSPPFNHFEIADYRDRALRELGVPEISDADAVTSFAAERLRLALKGEADLIATLSVIKDLCLARDLQSNIYDFYTLYWTYTDLQETDVQWYGEGATRENIVSIIRQRAEAFLRSTEKA